MRRQVGWGGIQNGNQLSFGLIECEGFVKAFMNGRSIYIYVVWILSLFEASGEYNDELLVSLFPIV